MKIIIFCGFSYILSDIFSATVDQEVTILFSFDSLTRKLYFICICFMQYSSFAHKFNLNLWMET